MRGVRTATGAEWPDTHLQRCLVHVRRDARRDLTLKPKTQAGKELRKLSLKLTRIETAEQVARRAEAPDAWHERWRRPVNEKSTARSDPRHPKALAGRTWWWTHERLRRAYKRFERLFRNGEPFAFLEPGLLPGATNRLEGGVNSPLKRVLLNHRGMIEAHMMRDCEYECHARSPDPDPKALPGTYERRGKAQAKHEREAARTTGDEPIAGNGLDWNEFHTSTPYPDNNDQQTKAKTPQKFL